jgi:hypothetical protein
MSAAYRHLALALVQPGMVLSDELLDKQGNILLPKGAVLSAKTIGLLPRHGIEMLAVCAGEAEAASAPDLGAVELRLAKLFRKNDIDNNDDWATGILRRYISDYRMGVELEP